MDGVDNDKDGKKDASPPNTRCPKKDDGTWDLDGDGYSNSDEDALGSVAYDEADEPTNDDDNCPYAYNPDQANNDGRQASNGPFLPNASRSNPTGDTYGDACDVDDDNDRYTDPGEVQRTDPTGLPAPTDPYNKDTDGDGCGDGVESILGSDPLDPLLRCGNLSGIQQYFFRACHFNLPDATKYPDYNPGYSGPTTEMDPDGDLKLCPFKPGPPPKNDPDADSGSSKYTDSCCATPPCNCVEVADTVEIEGYNTAPAVSETDGDNCEDWCEICDVNGDRLCDGLDRLAILRRVYNYIPPDVVTDYVLDVNKDNQIDGSDAMFCAMNSSLVKPPGDCTSTVNTDMQRLLP